MKRTEILFDALCNGVSELRYSGLSLETKKADNDKLKEMYPDFFKEHFCYEDRLMLLYNNGFSLYLVDDEGDSADAPINKEIVKQRYKELKNNEHFNRVLLEFKSRQDDSNTASAYLQFMAYGEHVYG